MKWKMVVVAIMFFTLLLVGLTSCKKVYRAEIPSNNNSNNNQEPEEEEPQETSEELYFGKIKQGNNVIGYYSNRIKR